jgi:MoxR-like ATPase
VSDDLRPASPPRPPSEPWWLFQGTGEPIEEPVRDQRWRPPPPWRAFNGAPDRPAPPEDADEDRRRLGAAAAPYLTRAQISVVNAAIHLRRPLLVSGGPGSGKSTLAHMIARELRLGRVLRWPITSRTTLASGLYGYDAVGRAQATLQVREALGGGRRHGRPRLDGRQEPERPAVTPPAIGEFVHLRALGTALLPQRLPRVLLVDEMDKSEFDLPNDLLNIFEDGEFEIPELVRIRETREDVEVITADRGHTALVRGGVVRCNAFPIIVITSNGERDFPPAFLRRCVRLDLPDPAPEQLAAMVRAHFPDGGVDYGYLVAAFVQRRGRGATLAADQLLNAVHLAIEGALPEDDPACADLLNIIWRSLEAEPSSG